MQHITAIHAKLSPFLGSKYTTITIFRNEYYREYNMHAMSYWSKLRLTKVLDQKRPMAAIVGAELIGVFWTF